jgi:type IX secretion system PorP/SprF family membrane protein
LNRKSHILSVLLVCLALISGAQDIHFSQFTGSLLNLTPGFTGFYDGDYRVGAIYRSQWQSVPVRYNSFSMHGEKVISPLKLEKDLVGVGFTFNSDRAGDARYGTTQAYLSGSYIVRSFADTSIRLSIGASAGWNQVGFDYSKMTFDAQFDGEAYNHAMSSNERFGWTARNFLDLNFGFALQKKFENASTLSYGFGLFHLTRPNISYMGNDQSRLDLKWSNVITYNKPINTKIDLLGECLLSFQGKYVEIIPNLNIKYFFDRSENKAILGGLSVRANDALIVRMGYSNKLMNAGVSYDINLSHFTPATNRRGGFEIYIIQIINSQPAFVAKKRPCPSFL